MCRTLRERLWATAVWTTIGFFVVNLFAIIAAVITSSLATRWLGSWLPSGWTVRWYASAWEEFQLDDVLFTTFQVVFLVVLIAGVTGVPAAYALARRDFADKSILMLLFLLPPLVPPITYGIPLATVLHETNLAGSVAGVDRCQSGADRPVRDPDTFGSLLARYADNWEAPDGRTIRLRLNKPFGLLTDALAHPSSSTAFMMPERIARTPPTEQVKDMIGSGPLRFRADSPTVMAATCDVIFSCLPDLHAIESVALGPDGILSRARPGAALFEMSTNSAALVRQLHDAFRAKGAHMLDAPISGGAGGAIAGRLAMWVGGDRSVFDRCKLALDAMADRVVHVGPSGAGLVTKLVHNCSSQAMQAALAEVFVMGVKAGADPVALWEAIRQGSVGRRRAYDCLIDEFLPGTYDSPSAALRIVHKDMMVATGLARDLGVPMRFANLALADIVEAMNRGWSERDARCVMLLPQERAGVHIHADPERIQAVLDKDPPAPTDTRRGKP